MNQPISEIYNLASVAKLYFFLFLTELIDRFSDYSKLSFDSAFGFQVFLVIEKIRNFFRKIFNQFNCLENIS